MKQRLHLFATCSTNVDSMQNSDQEIFNDEGRVITGRELFNYYQHIKLNRILFVFKGAISQDTLVELGDVIAHRIGENMGVKQIKKLFGVLIEMAQNILHYSFEREFLPQANKEVGVGILLVQYKDNQYALTAANLIDTKTAKFLDEKLSKINSLPKEDLRAYYLEERKKDRPDSSKGAGLGLIDIAKKSGNSLQYSFHQVDENSLFFVLTVLVDKE